MIRISIRTAACAAAVVAGGLVLSADRAQAGGACCAPPPHEVRLCVQDPCGGCAHTVCVCVPGCCTEPPCVSWRSGVFGRRVACYTWKCCGHSIEVVVTKHDKVIVRG